MFPAHRWRRCGPEVAETCQLWDLAGMLQLEFKRRGGGIEVSEARTLGPLSTTEWGPWGPTEQPGDQATEGRAQHEPSNSNSPRTRTPHVRTLRVVVVPSAPLYSACPSPWDTRCHCDTPAPRLPVRDDGGGCVRCSLLPPCVSPVCVPAVTAARILRCIFPQPHITTLQPDLPRH